MQKFHFVYLTTNIINGKQYIGDHSTNNLEDIYVGSGIYIKYALNEYGINKFKREILEFFDTKEDAFNAQEKYIQQYNTLVPNGYNISPKGGIKEKASHSIFSREKMSKTRKGKKQTSEWIKKRTISRKLNYDNTVKEHYNLSEETKQKMKKPKTEETRLKMTKSRLGKKRGPYKR